MDSVTYNRELFNKLSLKFSQLVYGRSEGDRILINKTLDDLNGLNYGLPTVTCTTRGVLLVNNCCTLVPTDDSLLVSKCCQIISSLINRQHIQIEGRTLTTSIAWNLQALKQCEEHITVNVLIALDSLLRSNTQNLQNLVPLVVTVNGPLQNLSQKINSPEIILFAVQCLEACTIVPEGEANESVLPQLQLCTQIFLQYLKDATIKELDNLCYCKLLTFCLSGLQNVISQSQDFLQQELGLLLGIAKTYMVYGIKGIPFFRPLNLMPSAFSIPEPLMNTPRDKKGGKIAKQRKHKNALKKDHRRKETPEWYGHCFLPMSTLKVVTTDTDSGSDSASKLKTSDSEFSDNETGRAGKLGITEGRVRQAALNFFLSISRLTDKRTMFSYWTNFIPDGSPSPGTHSLTTCILKDPSPKGRMAALNVLLTLLTSSKLYLSQAEYSEKTSAFTPFSVTLGCMIKELHRCLSLALNENSIPVLTHVLKCLAALVQATPYHRLSKGIVTKIVRNVKGFIHHKDPTVQVAALIVLGCVLTSEPVILETKDIFTRRRTHAEAKGKSAANHVLSEANDLECFDFSSDDDGINNTENNLDMSWILEKCLENLGLSSIKNQENAISTPVKLESLKVLCAMSRNYFTVFMGPYLTEITKALELSLNDKYTDLHLHSGRTIDFIGQAMNQYFTNNTDTIKDITVEQGLLFWQTLIKDPLTSLLQNDENPPLRAVGCDCFGSIGSHIFAHLPRDKQILVITLLFACSRDDEKSVKGAAVRALAICVLYPSLREDPGFVVDVAEAILRTLKDENMTVRIKASWSLGNLSDALALNRTNLNIFEDIPNGLLLNLLTASVKVCNDNDKVRTNAVRAIGNLLQLVESTVIIQNDFKGATDLAIETLVINSTSGYNMKVRWNSCYALGNILKNPVLFEDSNARQDTVFAALMELVINFRNFKVRINAALALASPSSRRMYGQHYYAIWNSLLKALENSQNMEDFCEYKHRDHLINQICLSLGHLCTFLTVKDLSGLQDSISFYFDHLKMHMHRVLERLLPEKSNILLTAAEHISSLLTHSDITNDQKEMVSSLANLFKNEL